MAYCLVFRIGSVHEQQPCKVSANTKSKNFPLILSSNQEKAPYVVSSSGEYMTNNGISCFPRLIDFKNCFEKIVRVPSSSSSPFDYDSFATNRR